MNAIQAIAWGLDYVRFKVDNTLGLEYLARDLPYLEINRQVLHGTLCVDLTGEAIEVIRMFEPVYEVIERLAYMFQISRLDAFVDLPGSFVDKVAAPGTAIANAGVLETVYSHHLKRRGNVAVFGRCYDACAAGHYDEPMTRIEFEFKHGMPAGMVNTNGWIHSPIDVVLHYCKEVFGVVVDVDGHKPVDFNAPRKRYSHSRERFYARYGKNILLDLEDMGVQGLATFIRESVGKPENGH